MVTIVEIVIYLIGVFFGWILVSGYKFIDGPDEDDEDGEVTGC